MRSLALALLFAVTACAPLTEARAPRDPQCPPATCRVYPGPVEAPQARQDERFPNP